jgi:hypothetical protein
VTSNSKDVGVTLSRLDNVFDKALVLLGVLAASELAYVTALPLPADPSAQLILQHLKDFTFLFTTVPFVILILAWILKELVVKVRLGEKTELFTSLFCWDYWSFSLYGFLLVLFSLPNKLFAWSPFVVAGSFALSIALVTIVALAYGKIRPSPEAKEYIKSKWYKTGVMYTLFAAVIPFLAVCLFSLSI